MISQLIYGGFRGFWDAIILHMVTSPIDILVCLVLSIWGSAVLTQDGTAECSADEECKPFILVARTNVILGYAYIFTCLFIKPLILGIFVFCCNGL